MVRVLVAMIAMLGGDDGDDGGGRCIGCNEDVGGCVGGDGGDGDACCDEGDDELVVMGDEGDCNSDGWGW